MSKIFYVRDTSASRRTRALYSVKCDIDASNIHHDNNNNKNDVTRSSTARHSHVINETNHTNYPMWDQMSMDSGFCSDLERKVAQLSVAGSDVGSVDECSDVITANDIRAPSRAKLTQEEKRKRNKIRTLPPPGRGIRWNHCDDVRENFNDVDDLGPRKVTSIVSYNSCRQIEKKSKTLPVRTEKKHDVIRWDDVSLTDLRQLRVLGGGGYARVDLVEIKRHSGHRYALKKLNKRLLQDREQVGHVVSEKEALKHARSRFIPRLFRTFQTPNHVFMLTEACLGGDLFSVLENHGALHYEATRYVIACVTEALDHLHKALNIIHRDVKTENILIDSNGTAKLGDLGFCKRLPHNCEVTYTFCGTPGYVAPEVLLRTGHGRSCDFFSTGVVMFEAATCRSPFRRHSSIETHRATLRGIKDVAFPPFVDHVTVEVIRSLCYNDPDQRLGAGGCEQVRRHEIFCGFDWHRLRQGKVTSPLLNLISRTSECALSLPPRDDYLENLSEIVKTPYDKTWSENF